MQKSGGLCKVLELLLYLPRHLVNFTPKTNITRIWQIQAKFKLKSDCDLLIWRRKYILRMSMIKPGSPRLSFPKFCGPSSFNIMVLLQKDCLLKNLLAYSHHITVLDQIIKFMHWIVMFPQVIKYSHNKIVLN